MNAMLAKYLKDFSVPAAIEPAHGNILESLDGSPFGDIDFDTDPEPAIDIEAERREAYEEGHRAATELLEARHADEMAALRQAQSDELAAIQAIHENEVVGMVHTRFHEMTQVLSQTLADQTLQVLLPVFNKELASLAVATLGATVREALREADISTVIVRGSAELFAALKPLLDADGIDSRFIEQASQDLTVEINETVLATRLGTWAQTLSEVTG
ncbi:hypothetical protein JJB09_01475 [Rhizobium sp. KVB221]|uniref:Uncharacterized protein n=1 Tax=Rhizobium setariae TaxID=2801340 RepID=A0A937CNH8_9HYPH|nr:hypothetical protein [Rhizobium setariae]MBL0370687.1 hypothetical protein [Rhizobium setariae]